MKKYAVILVLFLLVFSSMGASQTISETEKQQVLQNLQFDGFLSGDDVGGRWDSVVAALDKVEKYKIVEAGPIIKSKIWWCEFVTLYKMMRVMYYLKDPDALAVTRALVDTAESILAGSPRKHPEYFENAKAIRYNAILQLFDLGDFTYADQFVLDTQRRGGLQSSSDRAAASDLARAVPAYRDFAKTELLKAMYADTTKFGSKRSHAEREARELIPYYLDDFTAFFEKTDNAVVNHSIAEIIAPLKYQPFEQALKLKLTTNRDVAFHDDYMDWLLEYYCSPENYQFIVNYSNNQQDEYNKQHAERELLIFKPTAPPVSIPVGVLIDSLISLLLQSQNLNWLGNANFVKELTNHLENAKKHLEKKDSLKCAQEVEKFQSKVNREYKAQRDKEANTRDNRFVTVEGWKFLYYNAHYIIDRLITLPAKSQGTILQQIDELKAEIKNQSAKNNLGGALLITSLNHLCDQAKRELQKKDSSETAIYIALFQHIVEETWETTEKIPQKRKKFGALYSDDAAYIALYYRAKYIVEALPARSFDLKVHRSQKIDNQLLNEMEQMKKESQ